MRSDKNVGRTGLEVRLLHLYPRKWRDKYGDEFLALLQQTGVGWRTVADVVGAAAREWVRTVVPPESLRVLAHHLRRGVGFYAFGLASLIMAQWLLPGVWRIDLTVATNHVGMMEIFLLTAVISSATERWGLGAFSRNLTSFAGSLALSNLSLVVSLLFLLALRQFVPMFGVLVDSRSPGLIVFLMAGQRFGRPSALAWVLKTGPSIPPRPPSIQGLGLSA